MKLIDLYYYWLSFQKSFRNHVEFQINMMSYRLNLVLYKMTASYDAKRNELIDFINFWKKDIAEKMDQVKRLILPVWEPMQQLMAHVTHTVSIFCDRLWREFCFNGVRVIFIWGPQLGLLTLEIADLIIATALEGTIGLIMMIFPENSEKNQPQPWNVTDVKKTPSIYHETMMDYLGKVYVLVNIRLKNYLIVECSELFEKTVYYGDILAEKLSEKRASLYVDMTSKFTESLIDASFAFHFDLLPALEQKLFSRKKEASQPKLSISQKMMNVLIKGVSFPHQIICSVIRAISWATSYDLEARYKSLQASFQFAKKAYGSAAGFKKIVQLSFGVTGILFHSMMYFLQKTIGIIGSIINKPFELLEIIYRNLFSCIALFVTFQWKNQLSIQLDQNRGLCEAEPPADHSEETNTILSGADHSKDFDHDPVNPVVPSLEPTTLEETDIDTLSLDDSSEDQFDMNLDPLILLEEPIFKLPEIDPAITDLSVNLWKSNSNWIFNYGQDVLDLAEQSADLTESVIKHAPALFHYTLMKQNLFFHQVLVPILQHDTLSGALNAGFQHVEYRFHQMETMVKSCFFADLQSKSFALNYVVNTFNGLIDEKIEKYSEDSIYPYTVIPFMNVKYQCISAIQNVEQLTSDVYDRILPAHSKATLTSFSSGLILSYAFYPGIYAINQIVHAYQRPFFLYGLMTPQGLSTYSFNFLSQLMLPMSFLSVCYKQSKKMFEKNKNSMIENRNMIFVVLVFLLSIACYENFSGFSSQVSIQKYQNSLLSPIFSSLLNGPFIASILLLAKTTNSLGNPYTPTNILLMFLPNGRSHQTIQKRHQLIENAKNVWFVLMMVFLFSKFMDPITMYAAWIGLEELSIAFGLATRTYCVNASHTDSDIMGYSHQLVKSQPILTLALAFSPNPIRFATKYATIYGINSLRALQDVNSRLSNENDTSHSPKISASNPVWFLIVGMIGLLCLNYMFESSSITRFTGTATVISSFALWSSQKSNNHSSTTMPFYSLVFLVLCSLGSEMYLNTLGTSHVGIGPFLEQNLITPSLTLGMNFLEATVYPLVTSHGLLSLSLGYTLLSIPFHQHILYKDHHTVSFVKNSFKNPLILMGVMNSFDMATCLTNAFVMISVLCAQSLYYQHQKVREMMKDEASDSAELPELFVFKKIAAEKRAKTLSEQLNTCTKLTNWLSDHHKICSPELLMMTLQKESIMTEVNQSRIAVLTHFHEIESMNEENHADLFSKISSIAFYYQNHVNQSTSDKIFQTILGHLDGIIASCDENGTPEAEKIIELNVEMDREILEASENNSTAQVIEKSLAQVQRLVGAHEDEKQTPPAIQNYHRSLKDLVYFFVAMLFVLVYRLPAHSQRSVTGRSSWKAPQIDFGFHLTDRMPLLTSQTFLPLNYNDGATLRGSMNSAWISLSEQNIEMQLMELEQYALQNQYTNVTQCEVMLSNYCPIEKFMSSQIAEESAEATVMDELENQTLSETRTEEPTSFIFSSLQSLTSTMTFAFSLLWSSLGHIASLIGSRVFFWLKFASWIAFEVLNIVVFPVRPFLELASMMNSYLILPMQQAAVMIEQKILFGWSMALYSISGFFLKGVWNQPQESSNPHSQGLTAIKSMAAITTGCSGYALCGIKPLLFVGGCLAPAFYMAEAEATKNPAKKIRKD